LRLRSAGVIGGRLATATDALNRYAQAEMASISNAQARIYSRPNSSMALHTRCTRSARCRSAILSFGQRAARGAVSRDQSRSKVPVP
jgi:hypothetical protein